MGIRGSGRRKGLGIKGLAFWRLAVWGRGSAGFWASFEGYGSQKVGERAICPGFWAIALHIPSEV